MFKTMSSHHWYLLFHIRQNGATPLHRACVSGRDDIALVLLENGADCFIKNEVRNPLQNSTHLSSGWLYPPRCCSIQLPPSVEKIHGHFLNIFLVLTIVQHFHQYRKPWVTIYHHISCGTNHHSLPPTAVMKIFHSSDLVRFISELL